MNPPGRPAAPSALAGEVGRWVRAEADDRQLKSRVTAALDQIREFVERRRSDLERRRNRLIQTPGFKDETRNMEAALGKINLLLSGGKNISRVFAAIDGFLDTFKGDETFDRDQVRTQLADAGDEFICAFHDTIRGTRLAGLLDVLCFMPYSDWSPRSVDQRNFRSPSAAQVSKLIEQSRERGIDVDGIDIVQLAAMIRIKLGITPRMNYHRMPANKLAEKLTSEEVITLFSSGDAALSEGFCRATAGILDNLRRWSGEVLGSAFAPAPPELEAEMVQLVYLATDAVRISGGERERTADYLWLLATVVASDHAVLKDILTGVIDKHARHPAVRERMAAAKAYLDRVAARVDGVLSALWAEARAELASLAARADALATKDTQDFAEFTELEALKEKRSDVVKSLIKLSESIQLIAPALLDGPRAPAAAGAEGRPLEAAKVRDRNFRIEEETRAIALKELEKLRLLIIRITEISRRGFAGAGAAQAPSRPAGKDPFAGKTSDGVDIAALSTAALQEKLCGSLQKVASSLRDFKGKVEGVRRRFQKGDLQHALNVLHDKTKKAVEVCDAFDLASGEIAGTVIAADNILTPLRDIMAAQTNIGARLSSSKLTPAERQPITALMYAAKLRPGDELRDIERMRTELAGRKSGAAGGPAVAAEQAPAEVIAWGVEPVEPVESAESAESAESVESAESAEEETVSGPAFAEAAATAPEDRVRRAASARIARLVVDAARALKQVKSLMAGLIDMLALESPDRGELAVAACALHREIGAARAVMAANLAQVESIAADCGRPIDEEAGRFARWQDSLASLEGETEVLLRAVIAVAGIRRAVASSAALERGIADTLRPPAERARVEPFVPLRQRCADALASLAGSSRQEREAEETLAVARETSWKLLKTAPRSVGSLCEEFAAAERSLRETEGRIAAIHDQFKGDRPGSR